MLRTTWLVPIIVSLLISCASTSNKPSDLSEISQLGILTRLPMSGDIGDFIPGVIDDPVHDPSLFKDEETNTYYVASTGILRTQSDPGGIFLRRSVGNIGGPWESLGEIPAPEWVREYNSLHLWAPSVAKVGSWFYLYYSASSFGSNRSAIGVTRTRTPSDLESWEDLGPVLTSTPGDDYNAIDPKVFYLDGRWWITFGSFWTGIKLQELRNMTEPVGPIYSLAHRRVGPNRVENPTIFKRGKYYYLVMSWETCCNPNATYRTAIGRSENLTGPYYDKNGRDLFHGGGNLLLSHRDNQVGPGGGDVFFEDGVYYFIHHYYDSDSGGVIRMQIRKMDWHDGWPYFADPGPYDLQDGALYRLIRQGSSNRCIGVADEGNVRQSTCNDSPEQTWRLEATFNGFYRLRSMTGNQNQCLELEGGSTIPGTNVRVAPCARSLPVHNKNRVTLQHWHLEDTGLGFHRITNESGKLALDNGNSTADGANIQGWTVIETQTRSNRQVWRFERLD